MNIHLVIKIIFLTLRKKLLFALRNDSVYIYIGMFSTFNIQVLVANTICRQTRKIRKSFLQGKISLNI